MIFAKSLSKSYFLKFKTKLYKIIFRFNGVRWVHDYQEACVDKVERFIKGELNRMPSLGPNQVIF